MLNKTSNELSFKNPIILGLITFVIITIFQIYKNYYKNKKDEDDYSNCELLDLLKPPIIAALLTWLVSNFLIDSINVSVHGVGSNQSYLSETRFVKEVKTIEPTYNIDTLSNVNNISKDVNSTHNTLHNIYTEQPDF